MKKLWIVVMMCMVVSGCSRESNKNITETDPSVDLVKAYIHAVANRQDERAKEYLMGEALSGQKKGNEYFTIRILDETYERILEGDKILIIEGIYDMALISKENQRFLTRYAYRYSLSMTAEGWKIFKIEEEKSALTGTLKNEKDQEAVNTVNKYLELVIQGNWNDAAVYLSGESLKNALRIIQRQETLNMNMDNLSLEVLGVNDRSAFIMGKYDITALDQKKTVQCIFQLEKISGEWRIVDIAGA
jgi:hypothetical protein